MADERSDSKGQAWFCATGLPSDVAIDVQDMTFHLHKFPLLSKSRKLHQLISQNRNSSASAANLTPEEGEIQEVQNRVSLPDFPGGSEIFDMVAKFCYGAKISITSSIAIPLRCAAEFLEMTEEYHDGNLISKTDRFLAQSVFTSMKKSIKALKSCDRVMPLAETLDLVQRCIDSVLTRTASMAAAKSGLSVSSGAKHAPWSGIESSDSLHDDIASLSLPLFKRFILSLMEQNSVPGIVESFLTCYCKKNIPGLSKTSRKAVSSQNSSEEQREFLESIITKLPSSSCSRSSPSAQLLFVLLRGAIILNVSEQCRSVLEKKAGLQLENATLDDLLIPSYSQEIETLYDVCCVMRILKFFFEGDELINGQVDSYEEGDGHRGATALKTVGKLIDGFLAEIASDVNLKLDQFYNMAVCLPDNARLFDDGLYRAIDIFLKGHPWTAESEKEKLCGAINCQKLTLEACTHAAQNEDLPVRTVVQVLFFEQVQLREALAGRLMSSEQFLPSGPLRSPMVNGGGDATVIRATAPETGRGWRMAMKENQLLRLDMERMLARVHQLEKDCGEMKKVVEKIEGGNLPIQGRWISALTRGFGCQHKSEAREISKGMRKHP